jgi:ribulose-bisphosphate carboxylase large chain
MEYIDLKYKPDIKDIICEFYLEPVHGSSVKNVANQIAAESSVGTWTDVKTEKSYMRRLGAKVFSIKDNYIKIAYPLGLFETGNVPQLLSSVAGNIFGMKVVEKLRLEDIHLPSSYIRGFRGPKYGIPGIRKLLKVHKRPLVGTIIKPKLGLRTLDHAKVAYDAWIGGCDIVKDDENLSSQGFNPFEKRVIETLRMRNKAEAETGEKKIYIPNVTAETNEMIRRSRFVKQHGGEYVMIDVITSGFSALQTLREEGMIIHAHRAGHAAFTRGKHGISMLAIAKLCRLIGVDQLHIGTIFGKMKGGAKEVKTIEIEIEKKIVPQLEGHALEQKWFNIKPVFAVCSGGLHPGMVPHIVKILGKNVIAQFGGGCHGHPYGTIFGAKAIRQAVDAVMQGIPLEEYALKHFELKTALDKWHY